MYSNSNVCNSNLTSKNIRNNFPTSKHLSPSPSPPLSMQQNQFINNNNSTALPSNNYQKSQSRATNLSDFDDSNSYNKPSNTNRQNINNNMNSSYLNSSSEFAKPTPLIDDSMKATTKGPEKLFSARNINQRINPAQNVPSNIYTSNTNLNNMNTNMITPNNMNSGMNNMNNINNMNNSSSTPPVNFSKIQNSELFATNKNQHVANGLEFDEEGSINSQYSCVSKLSSNSIQSDMFKGNTFLHK